MITISTSSIWYRFVHDNPLSRDWLTHYNLCPFIRQIFVAIFFNAFVATLAIITAFGTIVIPYIVFFVPTELWSDSWMLFTIPGGIIWVGVAILLIIESITWLSDRYHPINRSIDAVTSTGTYGLFAAWITAKHAKVCPTLDFVDIQKS